VPIANELVEALARVRIPGESGQVLWALLRLTYGWQKKEERIFLNRLVEMTGLCKPVVCRSLAKLLTIGIITKKCVGRDRIFGLQKDYERWKGLTVSKSANEPLANLLTTVSKSANEPLANLLTNNTKGVKKNLKHSLKTSTFAPNDKKHRSKAPTQTIPRIDFNFSIQKWIGITENNLVDWQAAYPACNVGLEIDRAGLWLLSNPTKRKSNYRRFLTNWMVRTQEKGGTR